MPHLPSAYRPESQIISQCLSGLANALEWKHVIHQAGPWIHAMRKSPPPFWAMESLLKEYPISSNEGLALMRIAESLLRVPDMDTAIALTADQLSRADFRGVGDSVLTRLSSTVIAFSKNLLPDSESKGTLLSKLGAQTVVAATIRAVQLLGNQFVLGQTIEEAISNAKKNDGSNTRFSFDMLGEGARTQADADHYYSEYTKAIDAITKCSDLNLRIEQRNSISVKLSALHPRYEDAQRERVMRELVPRVWALCKLASTAQINLTIDAEEVERLELSLDIFETLLKLVAQETPSWHGLGIAAQAYQTRAPDLIKHLIALGRKHRVRFMCRLVKGAYWDTEIKRAQELGLPHYPVFTHKHHTDISYLACAQSLLDAPDVVYAQLATHNAATIAAIVQMAAKRGSVFELQRLQGMGEGLYREVQKNPLIACRVYAPVGVHRDLLAYLVRRLLENGANSSFVHQVADKSVSVTDLLTSPLQLESEASLPLPQDIFGPNRRNSKGLDLADDAMRAPLLKEYLNCIVPNVLPFDVSRINEAVQRSINAYQAWGETSVSHRAHILKQAADALEDAMPYFSSLLVKEALKTWGDAISEVREAVDFLRYYACEAERIMKPIDLPQDDAFGLTGETNTLHLRPRGVWVCISPWNFPLAIFIGQIAAALATGNAVLAKPAEQTPVVAFAAVQLLKQAGVPADVLQLIHGEGDTVGAALVRAPEIAGVVFTGSTQVAKIIQRALAAKDGPITPLIAETGGINAMLVDSTALPEQVVDAVLQSAFRSAGQRCSALRLLVVHEAIADKIIKMIQGAAAELVCGDPSFLSTDIGPLIDHQAQTVVLGHVQRLQKQAKALLPTTLPAAFEVPDITDVREEIFGPVLHIARWGTGAYCHAQSVIKAINALGYGLTLGIQSRIDNQAVALSKSAKIGNVYINRNTIGAVVGLQPFGGEGLSGTGPKAGGPHYLYRFCTEQTLCTNTTAAGGNFDLMSRISS